MRLASFLIEHSRERLFIRSIRFLIWLTNPFSLINQKDLVFVAGSSSFGSVDYTGFCKAPIKLRRSFMISRMVLWKPVKFIRLALRFVSDDRSLEQDRASSKDVCNRYKDPRSHWNRPAILWIGRVQLGLDIFRGKDRLLDTYLTKIVKIYF